MAQLEAYAQCMRSHGIKDFPDPVANSSGGASFNINAGAGSDLNANDPRNKAADQACRSLLPQAPGASAQQIAALVKLASCIRAHGFPNFPDPDSHGAFDSSKFDNNSPQFQSAMNACQSQTGYQGPIGAHPGSGS